MKFNNRSQKQIRQWIIFLLGACLMLPLFSCYHLPEITQAGDQAGIQTQCRSIFAKGEWQTIYSIEATLSGGYQTALMGITQFNSNTRSLKCIMMTLEGVVLFDAEMKDSLVIHKGLPPFDAIPFAKGLIEDVELMFFEPSGSSIQMGVDLNHMNVCRFFEHTDKITDIVKRDPTHWELRQYNKKLRKTRTVLYSFQEKRETPASELPFQMTLKYHGQKSYQLILNRVKCTRISP